MLSEEELANLASVKFTEPVAKLIISPHSGSILAEPEPAVELPETIEKKARDIFNATEESTGHGTGRVPREKIVDMLHSCGYDYSRDVMMQIVKNRCREENIDERGWLDFLEKYQAPAYYYGQRLRQYCGRGQLQELSELIVRGCDVNSGDGEGLTPLHYACEANHPEVINMIFSLVGSHGLKVNSQDKYGWTPLHSAAYHGNIDCVKILLKSGVDVTITERYGKTALHLATAQARNGICDLLLSHGANVNHTDLHGMSALHEAVYKNNDKTYQMLCMNKAADVSIVDSFGNTPDKYFQLTEL